MIELKDVNKSFKGKQVLKHVSLTIQDGETLAIIGGSGSGKSTLLRLMIGLIEPTSGEIWIQGREISHLPEREMDEVRLKMGMVFQYSALFASMSVGVNVAFGLREHTELPPDRIQAIVKEKLQLVGLPGIETTMPNELSGGMKKRVSLARAIAFGPEIIFYDEPSSGLDPLMESLPGGDKTHRLEIVRRRIKFRFQAQEDRARSGGQCCEQGFDLPIGFSRRNRIGQPVH